MNFYGWVLYGERLGLAEGIKPVAYPVGFKPPVMVDSFKQTRTWKRVPVTEVLTTPKRIAVLTTGDVYARSAAWDNRMDGLGL